MLLVLQAILRQFVIMKNVLTMHCFIDSLDIGPQTYELEENLKLFQISTVKPQKNIHSLVNKCAFYACLFCTSAPEGFGHKNGLSTLTFLPLLATVLNALTADRSTYDG